VTVCRAGIAAVVIGVALSGCSKNSMAGRPVPSPTGADIDRSTVAPTGKQMLPSRPKELTLDGVDPCSLFPAERRADFEVDQPPVGPISDGRATRCSFSSPSGAVEIATDPERGAGYFLGDKQLVYGEEVAVGDYPAVSEYTKAGKDLDCFTKVDVANGQNLSIQYVDRRRPGPGVLCPIANKVALVALGTLKTQKK